MADYMTLERLDSIEWEVVVSYMDDDIRERLHNKLAPCTKREFLNAYLKAHFEKYGDNFIIN